jgi:hypothetical protein
LAKIYQNPRTGGYVGGLWESSIAFGLAWDYERPGSVGGKPTQCLSRRRPTWSWASHDCVVNWPGAYDNFVTNQYFALVRTDLEFLGQNPGNFNPVTGGSITVTGKLLEIPYKLEPRSCDLEKSLAGHRLRLLFDHPLPAGGSKSSIWRAISSAIDKVVKAIVLGGFPVYINQRIYFLLVAPHHGDASASSGHRVNPIPRRPEEQNGGSVRWPCLPY